MTQEIASRINRDCQCMLDAAYITEYRFSCDPQEGGHVIYRAQLSSTPSTNSTDLIRLLQQWVTSGSASVTLDRILDPTCSVMINSFDDPICPAAATPKPPSTPPIVIEPTSNLLVPILIVVIVLLVSCIFVVTTVRLVQCYRNKFSRKYHIRSVVNSY